MLKQDLIREAASLTRASRLVEATALLQRMLRGESAPDARVHTSRTVTGREPPTIDAEANAAEERDHPRSAQSRPFARPDMFREFLDRTKESSRLGVRGLTKNAPPSMRDIAPEGARFVEGTYRNQAGSRAYRLFIPAAITANRFRWS